MQKTLRTIGAIAVVALLSSGCTYLQRFSVDAQGSDQDGSSGSPMISADGRYVAFTSSSNDLVPNDHGESDVFVRDLATGKTSRASVSLTGGDPDAPSGGASISADGRYVAFASLATLVTIDTNFTLSIYVRDRQTGTTELVSVRLDGQAATDNSSPAISANGRYVAFSGESDGLVPNDHTGNPFTPDVFVRDLQNDTTVRASVDTAGGDPDYPAGFDGSSNAAISTTGRYVTFTSAATDLVAGDGNGKIDVFVRDLQLAKTTRVSVDTAGGDASADSLTVGGISADGRYVTFESEANDLVAGDANGKNDVFVRDLQTATTKRVSADRTGGDADNLSSLSSRWSISGDGRFITFYSAASDLVSGDGGQHWDVFVRDMVAGKTTRVSETANHADAQGTSDEAAISGDGRYVAFASDANNLVPNDGTDASVNDLFIRDVRVPALTAIAPATVARGSTATLTLTGTGFIVGAGAPRVAILGGGVTVSSATAVSETKVEVTISVATDAPLGGRAVIVANRGTGPGPGAASYGACACLTVVE